MGEEGGVGWNRGQERTGVFEDEVPVGTARGRRHGNCVKRRSCEGGLANLDDELGGGDEAQLCCGKVREKSAGCEGEGHKRSNRHRDKGGVVVVEVVEDATRGTLLEEGWGHKGGSMGGVETRSTARQRSKIGK
ncbi:hypothetical protein ERJ75_000795700 [Trypanosoma vivax]|nr:hypothetical protein ERJ75_000795700 [Trypanosoma vivax]